MKEFIDEYKHLEKLCNEIYDQQHGITQYITDMEKTPSSVSGRINGWHQDLSNLKRLRHMRNAMVHDTSGYEIEYSQSDLAFLRMFRQRIMDRQDPLALIRHKGEQSSDSKTINTVSGYSGDVEGHNNTVFVVIAVVFLIVLVIAMELIGYMILV